MKRSARRDSPPRNKYRRETGSAGRNFSSFRGSGIPLNSRTRILQQISDRRNQRPSNSSFARSAREFVDSGRKSATGLYHSGPSLRRFSQRSSGNSGNIRSSNVYNQSGSTSDRFAQGFVPGGDMSNASGTKIDPVFAAAAAAALNATLAAPSVSSSNIYSPNSSATVAAVAAAAMNAAALAAALGGNNYLPNNSNGANFQLPGISSQMTMKPNRSSPMDRRGNGNYRNDRPRQRESSFRHDSARRTSGGSGGGGSSSSRVHPSPEDDPTATRTLFVGNLAPDIRISELRHFFDAYGILEDIDIKRPQSSSPNEPAYAFVKYVNVSMAYRAKVGMSGKRIAGVTCKIGYGKVTPTRCLWIGGLGPWTTYPVFASIVERFSRPKKIIWPSGKGYANILYSSSDAAAAAASALRGYCLGGSRLRVDFTDEAHMLGTGTIDSLRRGRTSGDGGERAHRPVKRDAHKHQHSRSPIRAPSRLSSSESRSVDKSVTPCLSLGSCSPSVTAAPDDMTLQTASTIDDLASCLSGPVWKAVFVLKKSNFFCRLHAVFGDFELADQFIPRQRPKPPQTPPDDEDDDGQENTHSVPSPGNNLVDAPLLRISQRMKMDSSKLDDVKQRLKSIGSPGYCVLLATEAANEVNTGNHGRPLRDLISYLANKEAAGVVLMNADQQVGRVDGDSNGVLHVLPPGEFAVSLLVEGGATSLQLRDAESGSPFLVILLVRSLGLL